MKLSAWKLPGYSLSSLKRAAVTKPKMFSLYPAQGKAAPFPGCLNKFLSSTLTPQKQTPQTICSFKMFSPHVLGGWLVVFKQKLAIPEIWCIHSARKIILWTMVHISKA